MFDDWLGGFYASPDMQGTRAGLPMATAWAVMHQLGIDGYRRLTATTIDATRRIVAGVRATAGSTCSANPKRTSVAIARATGIDVFAVGDALARTGLVPRPAEAARLAARDGQRGQRAGRRRVPAPTCATAIADGRRDPHRRPLHQLRDARVTGRRNVRGAQTDPTVG